MGTVRVAVAQTGSVLFDLASTMERVKELCHQASAGGARLVVFPEAMLGGYPKGLNFGAVVGSRSEEGRDLFLRYWKSAMDCPGEETEALAELARSLQIHIVVGVIERGGGTLYCTGLVFTPADGLVAQHRKLMPTGSERLIWGQGDGSTMKVVETEIGRIGVAICWENYMPMYRQHLYAQGVQIWCAPTVDQREMWQVSMRHIAYEGRCYVLSACQRLTKDDWPIDLRDAGGLIDGRSLIVSPHGEILAGPATEDGLSYADVDLEETTRGRFDLDVAGHYARPDVFRLTVDEGPEALK